MADNILIIVIVWEEILYLKSKLNELDSLSRPHSFSDIERKMFHLQKNNDQYI